MENTQTLSEEIKNKHGISLTNDEILEILKKVADEISFGSCELEIEIVKLLMALHSLDEDKECNDFYYNVQDRLDDLKMEKGEEPIKDRVFANCIANLIVSGHVEEIKTLDYHTGKVIKGQRLNIDFKTMMHNVTLDEINSLKAKKSLS